MSVSDALVAFSIGPLTPSPKTRAVAEYMIAGFVGRALANARSEPVEIAVERVGGFETPPQAAIFGRSERMSAQWAAFVNGISAHAAIVPAVLALAERNGVAGALLVDAVIVGTEAVLRLEQSIAPEHTDRGWDPSGTVAHVGAVLAAGRVLSLDATQQRNALGIAATQAAGLWAAHGTMTQAYHLGKAAADAVEAALLAQAGFTGPAAPIEGRRGFVALLAGRFQAERIISGLGTHFEIDHTTLAQARPGANVREVLARYSL